MRECEPPQNVGARWGYRVSFDCFYPRDILINTTLSNISDILCRLITWLNETEIPGHNQRPAECQWQV
jgi:hypothetical protein